MIDLDAVMEELEADGSHVRLYHARKLGMWVAQTFDEEPFIKATAHGTGDTPEEALNRLRAVKGQAVQELIASMQKLRKKLTASTMAMNWRRVR